MATTTTILCDIDGVAVNRFTALSVKDFCAAYGIEPDAFNAAAGEAARGLDVGQKKESDYFSEIATRLSLDMTSGELQGYFAAADARNIRRNEPLYAWLEAAGRSGMTICAATNVSRELAGRLEGMGIYDVFRKRYFSCEIGAPKAERGFWAYVLADLVVAPESIVFIDDNKDNVAEAKASGIQGVVYHDFDELMQQLPEEAR